MEDKKLFGRTCPVCGEAYNKKNVGKIMLGFIAVDMTCEQGHTWTEHYTMTYTGFKHNNKEFDRFGQEVNHDS